MGWPSYSNSLVYVKYFLGCIVCIPKWFSQSNLIYLSSCNLHRCNSCPCFYALVGEIKFIYLFIYLFNIQDVLRMSWGNTQEVIRMSWGNTQEVLKMSWGNTQQILRMSWVNIQDVLRMSWGNTQEVLRMSWGNTQEVLRMSWGNTQEALRMS